MLELFGTRTCPYTAELREELEWQDRAFVEYDVEVDATAMRRMLSVTQGAAAVPVLLDDGKVVQVGFKGRSCYVSAPTSAGTAGNAAHEQRKPG